MGIHVPVLAAAATVLTLGAATLERATPAEAHSEAAAPPLSTLDVTVQYVGPGTVDESHRVWVWLFDRPDFAASPSAVEPVAEGSVATNGGMATFTELTASQIWVAVMFDERGGFQGQAPPPSGSPTSAYVQDGALASVAPGAGAGVRIVFDDTFRVP
jgi:hypothetical protein